MDFQESTVHYTKIKNNSLFLRKIQGENMTEMKILLSDDQMGIISTQLSDLITTEIEKIKTQENLQHRYE